MSPTRSKLVSSYGDSRERTTARRRGTPRLYPGSGCKSTFEEFGSRKSVLFRIRRCLLRDAIAKHEQGRSLCQEIWKCVRQHGFAVEVRADDEEDGGGAPSRRRRRRDYGAGRGEGDRAEQQRRDVDAVDGTHQRQRRGTLQERRLQGLEEQPRRRQ